MRVVVAGSSGLIGGALCTAYRAAGHEVVRLVRRPAQGPDEAQWDPGRPDPHLVDRADVVINLAGAPLGDRRWDARYRELIASSRIGTASALAAMTARAAAPPPVLVSMSGIRYYGVERADEELTEASAAGTDGFLPLVTARWEAATRPATEAGVRVCHLRTALVLSAAGGLLPRLLTPFRFGLGTTLGSGRAYWSFLSLHDAVEAVRFLAERPEAEGPYNLSAPAPLRATDFTRALASAVGKTARLRLPVWALRIGVGQMGPEVLGSLRVLPERLSAAGFRFRDADIESALRAALRERSGTGTGTGTGDPDTVA
ncbi:TIGR01777 family oxidoreductase [Catenulispora sp. NL8]|uniref:TIGR01777 family oxidoreductase n=1 Tax=Catenulispora pinistramenti TaxID=2705254 RepID=A0ABS5KPL6_9ACTN|nr:TIGR01777 family oxidoreductase [Catenulispora pinistramenti]MBS2547987.1 TIGR01777 family oxidoreductase [Catenulispora pinistramenti]